MFFYLYISVFSRWYFVNEINTSVACTKRSTYIQATLIFMYCAKNMLWFIDFFFFFFYNNGLSKNQYFCLHFRKVEQVSSSLK